MINKISFTRHEYNSCLNENMFIMFLTTYSQSENILITKMTSIQEFVSIRKRLFAIMESKSDHKSCLRIRNKLISDL